MKIVLRILLFPITMTLRLMLGITAFITTIAGSILGLTVSLFAVLGILSFCTGYWQNGIAFFVLALLVSPVGLPMIADLLLDGIDKVLGMVEGLIG